MFRIITYISKFYNLKEIDGDALCTECPPYYRQRAFYCPVERLVDR